MNEFVGFNPLIYVDSKILVLGSFPSVKSRENNFYYGHPQNRFWKVLSFIFNEPLPANIDEKKALCQKHKIALWDVIVSSNLKDSSDSALEKSDFVLADIGGLLKKYPNIKKIVCNGKLSYKLYLKYFKKLNIEVVCLPSTSPANTRFDIDVWKKELIYN